VSKHLNRRATTAHFDSAYFRRYYFSPATRVTSAAEMQGRARLIAAVLRHAGIPVRTILDIGCGIGLLRKPFARVLPRARYVGVESSDYLVARYKWVKGSEHRQDRRVDCQWQAGIATPLLIYASIYVFVFQTHVLINFLKLSM
jgi:2-polyprenyl-3-methyl-5-hydroxy-6-metoxy-1,4-benzoquinol methylase